MRTRKCDNPDGGQDCSGSHLEYETCNIQSCPENKKFSAWTPWLIVENSTSRGGYIEKRFRFSCKAPISDPSLIKIVQAKEDERYCNSDGSCTKNRVGEPDDAWSEWSAWSSCSKECGGGIQERSRSCDGRNDDCEGQSHQSRPCNTHRCKGEWSCWTDWSDCSVTCGLGEQTRTRECYNAGTKDKAGAYCEGAPIEHRHCEMPSCHSLQGWDEWTVWSRCDENNEQQRRRKCLTNSPGQDLCQGKKLQVRMCVGGDDNDLDNEIALLGMASSLEGKGSVGVGVVLGCSFAAFLVGLVAAIMSMHYLQKKRKVRIPGSPHYISSKQNPYVTVPLREPPKRTPSSCSSNGSAKHNSTNGNGIVPPKIFSSKPNDYETATIKRNSHSLNGHAVRAQLDEDKFF